MQKNSPYHWNIADISLSIFVLFILLFFTYGIFVHAPYTGFVYDPATGRVLTVYDGIGNTSALQEGDTLIRIGDVSWKEFKKNTLLKLFDGTQPGDVVEIVVHRGDGEFTIPWQLPGFNRGEFNFRFFNIWWLAYVYWLFGTITLLFMRPKDTLRWLLTAANYLTGLLLIFGSMSSWHLWGSSILLHATAWLVMAVYLHLHWIFPKPLYPVSKWNTPIFYALCLLPAAAELFQALPKSAYAFAFLFALVGSAGQQAFHFIKRPEQRREVGFLGISIALVIAPFIGLLISGVSSKIAFLTFFSLPFMPLAYFYAAYRRQMGGLELRANRLISAYSFLIILGTLLLFLFQPVALLPISHEAIIFLMTAVTLLTAFLAITVFPSYQSFVEQRFLGIKLPYQNLQEVYSSRIAASASLPALLQLLNEDIFPSLFVRQYAFMQVANGHLKTLLAQNVAAENLPAEYEINNLVARSGKYIPNFSTHEEWTRLILPLKVGDNFIGFWLLGRRDPDDLYSLKDIPILQSIANQTAIALSNLLHAEQLRQTYQVDVERYEQERLRLALDLHDSILNQLAVLRNNFDEIDVSPKFQAAYEEITHRLREIVSNLRPPMLMYGLKPAIIELADNLMERSNDKVRIIADLETGNERIPETLEQHLFRIVQEACENSIRHADPKTISIYGTLTSEKVDLNIHDDGKGFEANSKLELDSLLAKHHFGLSGMLERAFLIGAKIKIHSSPNTGTRIHLTWSSNNEVSL